MLDEIDFLDQGFVPRCFETVFLDQISKDREMDLVDCLEGIGIWRGGVFGSSFVIPVSPFLCE